MTKIISLDEAFEQLQDENSNIFKVENQTEKSETKRKTRPIDVIDAFNRDKVTGRVSNTESNIRRAISDSKSVLDSYISRLPNVKEIELKIADLKSQIIVNKSNQTKVEILRNELNELIKERNTYDKIFKRKEKSTKENVRRKEIDQKLRNNPEYLDLLIKHQALLCDVATTSASKIVTKYFKLKSLFYSPFINEVGMTQIDEVDEVVNETEFDEIDQITNDFDSSNKPESLLETDFNELTLKISEILNIDTDAVSRLKITEMRSRLNFVLSTDSRRSKMLQAKEIFSQITKMRNEFSNTIGIETALQKNIDFTKPESEKITKDILASSYIETVNLTAYSICRQQNKLNHLDEAVNGGLLGLSIAINRWFEIVSENNDASLSFDVFSKQFINGEIRKAIYGASGNHGTSNENKSTIDHLNKKRKQEFLKYHPEYSDLNDAMLEDLLTNTLPTYVYDEHGNKIRNKMKLIPTIKIGTASSYDSSDDSENGFDILESSSFDVDGDFDKVEAHHQYNELLKTIGKFMDLFEVKTIKGTNFKERTEKKLFDKYERKLMMMLFGFEHKRVADQSDISRRKVRGTYSQQERLEQINLMMLQDKCVYPSGKYAGQQMQITQEALSLREKKLIEKIGTVINDYPEMEKALRYMFNYYNDANNNAGLNLMSNWREEKGIQIDRCELRTIFQDNQQIMNARLIDGRTLADAYDMSEENMLEDDEFNYAMFGEDEY